MGEETTTTSGEGTGDPGPNGAPGGTTPPTPPAATPPATPPPAGDKKEFTQADLDKHAGRRAAEAKRAAQKEVADALGVSIEDAKQIIAERQAAAEAEKTEVQRAQDAAAKAQADLLAAQAETARLQRESLIERKLVAAGVGSGHPADKRESVLTRARAALQLAADADAEAIDAEIQATVELIPGLITPQASGEGKPPAPSGVTSGATPPAGGQPAKSGLERGREIARSLGGRPATPDGDPFAGFRTA